MSEYLLSVHHAEAEAESMGEMTPEQMQPLFEAVDRFNEKVKAEGAWVFAGGLMPIEQSTTVDATGAKPIVTDGPFAESKEYLGGFWVIEAARSRRRAGVGHRGLGRLPGPGRGTPLPGCVTTADA